MPSPRGGWGAATVGCGVRLPPHPLQHEGLGLDTRQGGFVPSGPAQGWANAGQKVRHLCQPLKLLLQPWESGVLLVSPGRDLGAPLGRPSGPALEPQAGPFLCGSPLAPGNTCASASRHTWESVPPSLHTPIPLSFPGGAVGSFLISLEGDAVPTQVGHRASPQRGLLKPNSCDVHSPPLFEERGGGSL